MLQLKVNWMYIDRKGLFGTKAQTIHPAESAIQSSSDMTAQVQSRYALSLGKFDERQVKDTSLIRERRKCKKLVLWI